MMIPPWVSGQLGGYTRPFPELGGRFWNFQPRRCPAAALPVHKVTGGAAIAVSEVKIRLRDATTFYLFAQNTQNAKTTPIFPSRNARCCVLTVVDSGAPLLQFWHHEVTDPRAKAKTQEGFQRDRGIPATSKNLRNSYGFLTLAEKLFHAPIQKKDGVL